MTQRQVDGLPGPAGGRAQAIHGTDFPGLLVVVGRRGRRFAFQFDVREGDRRVSRRKVLEATTIGAARTEAGALKAAMASGQYVAPARRKALASIAAQNQPVT